LSPLFKGKKPFEKSIKTTTRGLFFAFLSYKKVLCSLFFENKKEHKNPTQWRGFEKTNV